jgi:hypothetical protein
MDRLDAEKVVVNIKSENDKNMSKVSHKFSIESILGLSSHKSSSVDDATKLNRLELMDFPQKGMRKVRTFFRQHTCSISMTHKIFKP